MNPFAFLVDVIVDLYLMVVLLRFWMQLARADFYNPISQFVVKATNPVLVPLRRLIPGLGGIDTPSLVLAYGLIFAKICLISLINQGGVNSFAAVAIVSGFSLLNEAITLVMYVVIIRAILSWFAQGGHNPAAFLLTQLTDPLLKPIRKIMPDLGGLDLSPMVLLIGIMFLQQSVAYFVGPVLG